MKIQRIAAVTVLTACFVAAGCAGPGGGGANGGDGQAGSASGNLPDDARRVAESTTRLIHRPLREGTIWVVDGSTNKVIYTGPVRASSNVVVDPAANALTVNDQQVKPKTKLETGRTYQLYFKQRT